MYTQIFRGRLALIVEYLEAYVLAFSYIREPSHLYRGEMNNDVPPTRILPDKAVTF